MGNSTEGNYIAWHLPSGRWAKKFANGNLESPDAYENPVAHEEVVEK
jgi:hypothetical protein